MTALSRSTLRKRYFGQFHEGVGKRVFGLTDFEKAVSRLFIPSHLQINAPS